MFIPHSPGYQISGAAKGLRYLHSCNVIHGDLKGVRGPYSHLTITLTHGQPNILVDNAGNARIVDFGLTTVTKNPDSVWSSSDQHENTARWTAPEVLNGGGFSKEADIFSFAMVMIEVRCGWCLHAEHWPTLSYQYRYSPARSRLKTLHLLRLLVP